MSLSDSQRATNETLIARVLRGLGLNGIGTAGLLGNFDVESGFDPAAYNANEQAIGLGQWEGTRRTALQRYASQTGGSEQSLATQLGYLGIELRADPALIADLNAAGSPAAAAAIGDARFERSAGTSRGDRMAAANAAAALAANPGAPITVPTGGGAGTTPAGWFSALIPQPGMALAPWVYKAGGAAKDATTDALDSQAGRLGQFFANAALKLTFITAGAALVVAGIYHTTEGPRRAATAAASSLPIPPVPLPV